MGLRNYRRLELSSDTWVWETTGDYSYPRLYGSGKLHGVTAILGYMGLGNYMRLQLSSDVLVWKNQDRLQLSLAFWVWELRNTRGYIWCRVNVDLSLIGWVSKVLISLLCTRGCKEIGTHIFCCFKTSPSWGFYHYMLGDWINILKFHKPSKQVLPGIYVQSTFGDMSAIK